jgi:hypothetical protein
MLFECLVVVLAFSCGAKSQALPPTDQTSFSYPANGAGVTIPFPAELATLTGLSDWPARDVTPPFTPNMAAAFDQSSIPDLPHTSDCTQVPASACSFWCNGCSGTDIVSAPSVTGLLLTNLLSLEYCQTFDDGPTTASSTLLDYLASVNQKTTYFQIGSNVADNYLLTQRQFSEGHQVGLHTWSHPDMTTLTNEEVYAEFQWTLYVIHAAIGQSPKYWRPPYGNTDARIRAIASQLGMTVISPTLLMIGCCLESRHGRL